MPESERPHASEPSESITILATMLSGSLMPSRIARFVGSLIEQRRGQRGRRRIRIGGGVECAVERRAVRREHAASDILLRIDSARERERRVGIALLRDHRERGRVVHRQPAMKRDPSGDIDSTDDAPATVRLRSTTPDATS